MCFDAISQVACLTGAPLKNFLENDRGGIAVGFMFCLVAVMAAGGLALDYGRVVIKREAAQNALDAAVLSSMEAAQGPEGQAAFNKHLQLTEFGNGTAKFAQTSNPSGFNGRATLTYAMPTTFLGILGIKSIPISVESQAFAPKMPSSLTLNFVSDQGWSSHTAEFWVQRPDGTQVMVASMAYVSDYSTGNLTSDAGTTTVWPSSAISLGNYTRFWVNYNVADWHGPHYSYSSLDPNSADHYFINGQQQPSGQPVQMGAMLTCGTTINYGLEDSHTPVGSIDWAMQDTIFNVRGDCTTPAPGSALITR